MPATYRMDGENAAQRRRGGRDGITSNLVMELVELCVT